MGRAPRDGLGGRYAAELGAVRAASDHEAGRTVAADERRIGFGNEVRFLERDVAVADPLPRIRGEEVLDEERHAAERAVGKIRARGGLASVFEPPDHHRVEGRIDAFDALDRSLEQLARRHIARRDECRLIGRVHPTGLIGECAHGSLFSTLGQGSGASAMMGTWPNVIATNPAGPEILVHATLSADHFRRAAKASNASRMI